MLKTKDGRLLAVKQLTWSDVITAITPTNPDLAKTMNLLDDALDCTFYQASYRFGDKIINDGECYLPLSDGGSISFKDAQLPDSLLKDLSYNSREDPLGLILSKNSEGYLVVEDGIQTQSIIHPGQMFGIPRAIDYDTNNTATTSALEFNLNAGSKSLFLLSKISDQIGHSKIQEHYGITLPAPTTAQNHWAIFVEIANKANCPWRCEVIYFSRAWIEQLKNDEWAALAKRLMHMHRASYNIWHKVADIWNQAFHEIERQKKFAKYYSMSSVNTAKQLFMLAANVTYGFKPATNEDAAPINLIIDAYTNVYSNLAKQKQIPIIMEAAKFDIHKSPIYYSINHSASTQNDLESSKHKSQIARLDEIRRIAETYTKAILETKNHIESLYEITKNTTFSYYHSNPENYDKINNVALLATEDKRFTNGEVETFPSSSLFFKGCIKIGACP